jgi:type I restriction enzyme M protein
MMITKQQLGNFMWGMADILNGKVEDYKSYILTLLFYKRLPDNYPWEEIEKLHNIEDQQRKPLNLKQLEQITNYSHQFIITKVCFREDVKRLHRQKSFMQNLLTEKIRLI